MDSDICGHACFGVQRLISAAWYMSKYVMTSVYNDIVVLYAADEVQHGNASRHAQSVIGPGCSNKHKGSEFCKWIPLTLQPRSKGA